MVEPAGSRSVSVGGSISGSVITTGDNNTINVQQASLPAPEDVDIKAELKALREILAEIDNPFVQASAKALGAEVEKPAPDKNKVTKALATGLEFAKDLDSFSDVVEKLKPRVETTVAWIGEHGHKLLPLVGLAL
ncbi:MAG: hypothetical protein AAFY72_04225 [Cyanobacteria bacterium J06649_4]